MERELEIVKILEQEIENAYNSHKDGGFPDYMLASGIDVALSIIRKKRLELTAKNIKMINETLAKRA